MSCPLKASYPANFNASAAAEDVPRFTVIPSFGGSGYYQAPNKNSSNAPRTSYRTLGSYMLGGNCCVPHVVDLCQGNNCGQAPNN